MSSDQFIEVRYHVEYRTNDQDDWRTDRVFDSAEKAQAYCKAEKESFDPFSLRAVRVTITREVL